MPIDPYETFRTEQARALDVRVDQIVAALAEDPYEVLERAGAANAFIDAVAERHVYRATIRRAGSVSDAIKALDSYTVVFIESDGALSDAYMRGRINTWIHGWRRRLEKLQRENPGV